MSHCEYRSAQALAFAELSERWCQVTWRNPNLNSPPKIMFSFLCHTALPLPWGSLQEMDTFLATEPNQELRRDTRQSTNQITLKVKYTTCLFNPICAKWHYRSTQSQPLEAQNQCAKSRRRRVMYLLWFIPGGDLSCNSQGLYIKR